MEATEAALAAAIDDSAITLNHSTVSMFEDEHTPCNNYGDPDNVHERLEACLKKCGRKYSIFFSECTTAREGLNSVTVDLLGHRSLRSALDAYSVEHVNQFVNECLHAYASQPERFVPSTEHIGLLEGSLRNMRLGENAHGCELSIPVVPLVGTIKHPWRDTQSILFVLDVSSNAALGDKLREMPDLDKPEAATVPLTDLIMQRTQTPSANHNMDLLAALAEGDMVPGMPVSPMKTGCFSHN